MNNTETRRLPLWKAFIDNHEIDFGSSWTSEYMASYLDEEIGTVNFGMAIVSIRKELHKRGMQLSSKGSNGTQYTIIQANENHGVMTGYQRKAMNAIKSSVVLGINTPRDMLSCDEQRRHENTLSASQNTLLFMRKKRKELESKIEFPMHGVAWRG